MTTKHSVSISRASGQRKRLRGRPGAAFCCLLASASAAKVQRSSPSRIFNDIGQLHSLFQQQDNDFHSRLLVQNRPQEHSGLRGERLDEDQRQDRYGDLEDPQRHESRRLGAGVHEKKKSYNDKPKVASGMHSKGYNNSPKVDNVGSLGMVSVSQTPAKSSEATQSQPQTETVEEVDTSANNVLPFSKFTRIGGIGSQPVPLPTDRLRYPYMASLQIEGHNPSSGTFDYHVCAGVLVAPDIVMTAAHCAYYSPPGTDETYQAFNGIEIGKTDLNDEGEAFDPYSLETYKLYYEKLLPKDLHIHPEYSSETYEHDIMLVKVYGKSRYPPAKLNSNIEATFEGGAINVLGWGAQDSNGGTSDVMRQAQMRVVSNGRCERTNVSVQDPLTGQTLSTTLEGHIYGDMMCSYASDSHLCHGDAGGPVIYPGFDTESDVVLGVLSWGLGCGNSEYPAVSTRVADHYNWIRETICRESSDPPQDYECHGRMEQFSYKPKRTVTLKLRLDLMAVETGWVVESHPGKEVVAYRGVGFYKSDENDVVEETFELEADTCYSLTGLDSFGDGWCCDMGGGAATLYLGTDTGFYSGKVLAEMRGDFEYEHSVVFCL